jgi:hypothetical protein
MELDVKYRPNEDVQLLFEVRFSVADIKRKHKETLHLDLWSFITLAAMALSLK